MSVPNAVPLPEITPETEAFWTGGAHGTLLISQCGACSHWIHPPAPICPACLSRDIAARAVSGQAIVASFTVNWQSWFPDQEVPYVIAIVELPEQEGLRLTTRLVDCQPDQVAIGQPVVVQFEQQEHVWLPLFRPIVAEMP